MTSQIKVENKEKLDQTLKWIKEFPEIYVEVVQKTCVSRKEEIKEEQIAIETKGWYRLKTKEEEEEYKDQILSNSKCTGPYGKQLSKEEEFEIARMIEWIVVDKIPEPEEMSEELRYRLRKMSPFGFLVRGKPN